MESKKPKVTPALPRGMRDILPDQLAVRYKVIETLRRVFELYGFQPLETPAMERLEILSGKGGEESDKLSFLVMKRGAEFERALEKVKAGNLTGAEAQRELADMGLRYDLTVPLARVVAMYQGKLPMPFKRYQIAPVWRAERPQHGRYREFTQCDVDIVGTDSPVADVEIISIMLDGFDAIREAFRLGNWAVVVKVNHRALLSQVSEALGNRPDQFSEFCIALDKSEKVGLDGVAKEMNERRLAVEKLPLLWNLMRRGNEEQSWNELRDFLESALAERYDVKPFANLHNIVWHNDIMFRDVSRDFTLARGLEYYTGVVFEVVAKGVNIGSLGGGGRYDGLVGAFSSRSLPAVGTSFGLERIVDLILEETGRVMTEGGPEVVMINIEPKQEGHAPELASQLRVGLRSNGVACEPSYLPDAKLGRQIEAASRRGARFVILVGPNERREFAINELDKEAVERVKLEVKHLSDGEQRRLILPEIVEWIRESTK